MGRIWESTSTDGHRNPIGFNERLRGTRMLREGIAGVLGVITLADDHRT
jgi:hypothetical protein